MRNGNAATLVQNPGQQLCLVIASPETPQKMQGHRDDQVRAVFRAEPHPGEDQLRKYLGQQLAYIRDDPNLADV